MTFITTINTNNLNQESTQQDLLAELLLKARVTDTQPVSIIGVSTEAKQDLKLAELIAINTKLGLHAKLTDTQPVALLHNSLDAGGGLVVSNKTILGNYVMDSNNISTQLHREGTGTQTYSNGVSTMSVTSGQYTVCQSRQIHPYLAGKAQECEITMDNFTLQTNVVKKVGLFTSTRTAPYNTNYDGFYFEADGVTNTYNLVIANGNLGTETKIPSSSWTNPNTAIFSGGKFTICKIDFLYLGGSQVRFWVYGENGFELLYTYKHAGYNTGTIVKSPNLN